MSRDMVAKGVIRMVHIRIGDNCADLLLTKLVRGTTFSHLIFKRQQVLIFYGTRQFGHFFSIFWLCGVMRHTHM
jgi:hypothetical protein